MYHTEFGLVEFLLRKGYWSESMPSGGFAKKKKKRLEKCPYLGVELYSKKRSTKVDFW